MMPIMDGLDYVQQYHDWERYHRLWISQRTAGMLAHATPGDIEKGMKAGMDDDLKNKLVTFEVLSELINCDKQVKISNQIDNIERREVIARTAETAESTKGKQNVSQINGRGVW
jgi:CheY-like chemotaxis protein